MLDRFGNQGSKLSHQLIKLVSQEPEARAGGKRGGAGPEHAQSARTLMVTMLNSLQSHRS